jgi:hypothetical protein
MKRSELLVDNSFSAVKLLNHLIKKHAELTKKECWDKLFIVSENVNKFAVCGDCDVVERLLNAVKDVSNLMLQFGLKTDIVNDENISVEFHYAHKKNLDEDEIPPIFEIHQDDYGGTSYPVHTFICYNSVDLVGGDFAFYDKYETNSVKDASEIVNIRSHDKNFTKVVMFDGEIYHSALPIKSGYRYALSIQIKKG